MPFGVLKQFEMTAVWLMAAVLWKYEECPSGY